MSIVILRYPQRQLYFYFSRYNGENLGTLFSRKFTKENKKVLDTFQNKMKKDTLLIYIRRNWNPEKKDFYLEMYNALEHKYQFHKWPLETKFDNFIKIPKEDWETLLKCGIETPCVVWK